MIEQDITKQWDKDNPIYLGARLRQVFGYAAYCAYEFRLMAKYPIKVMPANIFRTMHPHCKEEAK